MGKSRYVVIVRDGVRTRIVANKATKKEADEAAEQYGKTATVKAITPGKRKSKGRKK